MANSDIRVQVIDAKHAHMKWVDGANLLIEGSALNQDMVPINETECGFGKWFFSDGQQFSDDQLFKEIGNLHEQLHDKYSEIVALRFSKQTMPDFLQWLHGKSRKDNGTPLEQARKKYRELNTISHDMVELLDQFLDQVEQHEPEKAP